MLWSCNGKVRGILRLCRGAERKILPPHGTLSTVGFIRILRTWVSGLGAPRTSQRGQRPPWCFLTKGAGVQTGRHRVKLLWSHICSACHVLQLRRGAGMQKFATARWLVNGCHSTPTVHIRKRNPSASAKPKVRDYRMSQRSVHPVIAYFWLAEAEGFPFRMGTVGVDWQPLTKHRAVANFCTPAPRRSCKTWHALQIWLQSRRTLCIPVCTPAPLVKKYRDGPTAAGFVQKTASSEVPLGLRVCVKLAGCNATNDRPLD
jgi:hypothetical protein